MDEVQLMGNGLATTAQLQAFRRMFTTVAPVRSLWMSATMNEDWLSTVDFENSLDASGGKISLDADRRGELFRKRFEASKPIAKADFTINDDGKAVAAFVKDNHAAATLTLVVVNTVKRAQAIYAQLDKIKSRKQSGLAADLVLLHSRFRQADRNRELSHLLAKPGEHGTIAVCTQVVEAGVDVSARLLVTELAPWSSLVQRFGRCNRYGEYKKGDIVWVPYAEAADDKKVLPYTKEELHRAAERLVTLSDARPQNLPSFKDPVSFTHVIRRKDMVELFDTTPDLAGADIDVSRLSAKLTNTKCVSSGEISRMKVLPGGKRHRPGRSFAPCQ
jgi:CRISPR-associated endonuclease/helicase Cas3